MSRFISEDDYELATLRYWMGRDPETEEISITVRSGGEVRRFILLRPTEPAVSVDRADCCGFLSAV